MNKNSIWVLVTDGDHARIMERENHASHLLCIQELSNPHETKQEHYKDKAGRDFESSTPGRHAYEAKTSWTDYRKELFINELAIHFVEEHQTKGFSKICLISSSQLMPILRSNIDSHLKTLHESKRPKITEISKNLTHHSVKEIEELLKNEMI